MDPAIVAGPKVPPYIVTIAVEGARAIAEVAQSFEPAKALKVAWRAFTSVAVIASVLALAMLGRAYWKLAMQTETAAKLRAAAVITPPPRPVVVANASTGQLHLTTDPVPARVIVDGKPRGVTPLLIENLTVGSHSVVLESVEGSLQETVKITAGDTRELNESIYPGWLTLYSTFDLVATEAGHEIPQDEHHQLLLSPGPHDLRFENRALGYEETRHVDMKPGEVASLSIAPPRSTLTVTSSAPAQVWLDGKLLGDTPLGAVPIDLGTHAVVLKRADGETRELSVTVTTKPVVLDM
ncbi:MAG: PEGA domain-containing protein [Acidobacteria bacterium]|nr:PEGA domain-containing protein [Acidobacteriota bacterium]